jgi:hypothetical protein
MKGLACDRCGRELEPSDTYACATCNVVLCSCLVLAPCSTCGGEMRGPANEAWLRVTRRVTDHDRSPRCDRCKEEVEYRPPQSPGEEEMGQETWWGDYCRTCNVLLCQSCRHACPTCGGKLSFWPDKQLIAQLGRVGSDGVPAAPAPTR